MFQFLPATLIFILGLTLLLKGADWLVDGSCSVARRACVSDLIVGLTIVSFGTSLPEFVINIVSRVQGETDITLGDVLGSNIANILLVLGISAALRPLSFKRNTLVLEIPFALAISVLLAALVFGDTVFNVTVPALDRSDGLILLTFFALFIFYVFRLKKKEVFHVEEIQSRERPLTRSLWMVIFAIFALALGARGVVHGAVDIAAFFGVHESVIALTIVAVGTSLPELATSAVAALRRRSDISVGNVVGSNIFNICWILGVSSFFSPLEIPHLFFSDMILVIAATLLLFLTVFFGRKSELNRFWGISFILCYAAYVLFLVWRSSVA